MRASQIAPARIESQEEIKEVVEDQRIESHEERKEVDAAVIESHEERKEVDAAVIETHEERKEVDAPVIESHEERKEVIEEPKVVMKAANKRQKSKLMADEDEQEAKDLLALVNQPGSEYPLALNFSSPENDLIMKFPRLAVYDDANNPVSARGGCHCIATCLIADDNIFNIVPLEIMLNDIDKIKVLKA